MTLKLKKSASKIIREKQVRDYFSDPEKAYGGRDKQLYFMDRFKNFENSFKTKKGIADSIDSERKFSKYEYKDLFYRDIKLL